GEWRGRLLPCPARPTLSGTSSCCLNRIAASRATIVSMAGPPTIGSSQVRDLLAALSALGLNSVSLCRAAGLQPATLHDPDTRVAHTRVLALFAEAERRAEDRLVALHAGEHAEPSGVLAYLVMSCSRLEDGLRQVERFGRLLGDKLRVRLE